MKKKVALLLVLVLVFSVFAFGCSQEAEGPEESEKDEVDEVVEVDFPTKEMTAICPWSAGGGTDAVLRGIAKAAEQFLDDTTIIVTNETGGGGAVGHGAIMNAEASGHTIGMITFELNSLPPQGLVPFTYEDFDILMRLNMDAAALTVRKDAPYDTIEEFIEYAKEHPGEINVGNAGPGSVWHIAAGLLAEKTGIEIEHAPFDGAAPGVTALVGGHIQAVSASAAEVQGQVEAGDLKLLGVMSDERDANFPDVPTFKESGIDVVFGTWRGLAVPKGVPAEVKVKLQDAFKKAYDTPEFQDFAKKSGLGLAYLDGEDFTKFLETNAKDVKTIMETLGLAAK